MRNIVLNIVLWLALSQVLQAQTLDAYLQTAGENSPELKARFREYEAALQQVPQVGALPDPELQFNFFLTPMERFMGKQVSDVTLMQMFPWFGTLEANRNEATYMAQMKFSAFADARNNLFHNVRTAWYRLYQNEQEARLLEQELEILKTLERVALAKYQSVPAGAAAPAPAGRIQTAPPAGNMQQSKGSSGGGMSGMGAAPSGAGGGTMSGGSMGSGGSMAGASGNSMVDVLLVRLQVRELENRVKLLHHERRSLQVAFNNLLNRPAEQEVVVADTLLPVPLPASLSLIQDSIRQNHPMLQMYEWDAKAREAQLRMAKLMGRPMVGLGVNYMIFQPRYDEMLQMNMGGENMVMPMVSVSLPIYRKKYNAAQKQAKLLQQSAEYQREATERQLLTELEDLLHAYEEATLKLELTQEQVQLTEQAARLLTTSYTVAAAGIEELLRQRQAVIGYKQQQLQALTAQHTAVSAINRMMNLAF